VSRKGKKAAGKAKALQLCAAACMAVALYFIVKH
jgi:hypothetical protein